MNYIYIMKCIYTEMYIILITELAVYKLLCARR